MTDDTLDVETINKLAEIAKNLPTPIKPSTFRGKEYYWLNVGAEQAGNVARGEIPALLPTSLAVDVRDDGTWMLVLLDADGTPVLICHPEFYCRETGCSIEDLMTRVGLGPR